MTLDMLLFGPHPDDVELGAGGIVALHTRLGYRVGICDLTKGELGTNGTTRDREQEAVAASKILNVSVRENANIADGFVRVTDDNLVKIINIIRTYRPKVILTPYNQDDHPDHIQGTQLVKQAAHLSGLKQYPVEGERHRPEKIYYYFLARPKNPDLVIDISSVFQQKMDSIKAYSSQLGLDDPQTNQTRLTHPSFLKKIEARAVYMGSLINCEYGEGLMSLNTLGCSDLLSEGGFI